MTPSIRTPFTAVFDYGLEVAGLTDVGRKRTLNEDNFAVHAELQLLLVADGMGGHETGEIASRDAVAEIARFLAASSIDTDPDRTLISDPDDVDSTRDDLPPPILASIIAAVQSANHVIYSTNKANGYADGQGMGTTIVGLWAPRIGCEAIAFHVGDSRLYHFREGQLSRLTTDHTLGQQWLDNGLESPATTQNVITRAIGPSPTVSVETSLHTLINKDVLLLCSDGLTNMVSDAEIATHLRQAAEGPLVAAAVALVDLANARGGKDNITVVLARYP